MKKPSQGGQALLIQNGQALLNQGQALLIVLLSLAVVLTVVLSILSRSVTDVEVTSLEEDALRAFSAAEAGIERALIIGSNVADTDFGGASFDATVSNFSEGSATFAYPFEVASGDIATVWFVAHEVDGDLGCSTNPCFSGEQMLFCWGKEGAFADPAVEISVYYAATPGDYSTIAVARSAYDPDAGRRSSNNFAAPTGGACTIESVNYKFSQIVDFGSLGIPSASYQAQNGLQFARVRMFYNADTSQELGVDVSPVACAGCTGLLPSQGERIESTGNAGDSTRKVEVFRVFADPPAIFDSAIFTNSPSGIVK